MTRGKRERVDFADAIIWKHNGERIVGIYWGMAKGSNRLAKITIKVGDQIVDRCVLYNNLERLSEDEFKAALAK